jgi:hypothetical protein
MYTIFSIRRPIGPTVLMFALLLTGCRGDLTTPPADLARSALERSLGAWQAGGRPGTIEGSEPPIQVVDSTWANGRKLDSFQVLNEEGGTGDRRFDVRLTQRQPDAEIDARYVVLGQGPVWVYRMEDYERMINMDDNPGPSKSRRRRR